MIKEMSHGTQSLRATKSRRSVDAASFITAAEDVLRKEYGCIVLMECDSSKIENMSFSPEYMNQALSLLATAARAGASARIRFELSKEVLTVTAAAPVSAYAASIKDSFIAESSADLGDFSYSVRNVDGEARTTVSILLKRCAAIALYAISRNDLAELIREIINK